jgi:hypothetical protein
MMPHARTFVAVVALDARKLDLSFGSDDGLVLFVNGRKVHENQAERGVAPDQDRVSVDLVAGQNFLVAKVVNNWPYASTMLPISISTTKVPIAFRNSSAMRWSVTGYCR